MKTKAKLLAIHGSPRKDGFSSTIHRYFLKPFADAGVEVEEIYVYEKKILPCTACGACKTKFICPLKDEMDYIYTLIQKAEIISISTPLYFSSFPSQLKGLIDRCQVFWEQKKLGNFPPYPRKKSVFICSAGSHYNDMFSGVLLTMRHFFNTINSEFKSDDAILVVDLDKEKKITLEIINRTVNLSEKIIKELNI